MGCAQGHCPADRVVPVRGGWRFEEDRLAGMDCGQPGRQRIQEWGRYSGGEDGAGMDKGWGGGAACLVLLWE